MSDKMAVILSQARDPQPETEKLERKILAGLERWPHVDVTVVPHLYDLGSDGSGMRALRAVEGEMIVLAWLYPRATYWVLSANGIRGRLGPTASLPEEDIDVPSPHEPSPQPDGPKRTIWCFDLRTFDQAGAYLAGIAEIISATLVEAAGTGTDRRLVAKLWAEAPSGIGGHVRTLGDPTRPRWYPVVDYARCTHCLECLNFCLFGVFGLSEADSILIEQPDACRAGCPACSRICPQGAIMFPQHNDPAIAGDPKASLSGLKLDLSQLFAGTSPAELAAGERERALAEQQAGQEKPFEPGSVDSSEPDDLDHLVDELDDLDL